MAKRKEESCITFGLTPDEARSPVLVEFLRYAGVVSIDRAYELKRLPIYDAIEGAYGGGPGDWQDSWPAFVTIVCPPGHVDIIWAERNCERIKSFGRKPLPWTRRRVV